jgi:hypothetical protein
MPVITDKLKLFAVISLAQRKYFRVRSQIAGVAKAEGGRRKAESKG